MKKVAFNALTEVSRRIKEKEAKGLSYLEMMDDMAKLANLCVELFGGEREATPAIGLSDAEINQITQDALGKWPSFDAQSWACKVVHEVVNAELESKPYAFALVDSADEERVVLASRTAQNADVLYGWEPLYRRKQK